MDYLKIRLFVMAITYCGIFVMANTVASTDAPILNDRKRKIPGSNSVQEKGHV